MKRVSVLTKLASGRHLLIYGSRLERVNCTFDWRHDVLNTVVGFNVKFYK